MEIIYSGHYSNTYMSPYMKGFTATDILENTAVMQSIKKASK